MKLSISIGGTRRRSGESWAETVDFVCEAERLGVDHAWSAEAWGSDSVTPLAYLAARTERITLGTGIMQVGTRTPAMMAQTALTMNEMTGGRFVLGLGVSGPQVIEGLHGVRFARPLARLRETVDIVRQILRGERAAYDGEHYRLPLPGGEGKSLKVDLPPAPDLPIFLATLGPRSLVYTGEAADGWLGTSFMPEHAEAFFPYLQEGLEASGRSFADLERLVAVDFEIGDDVERMLAARRERMAFVLGGMGSRKVNFYNEAFGRAGYADAAAEVQSLWAEGKRVEAAARVPDELILKNNLIGTEQMVRERVGAYRDCGVDGFRLSPAGSDTRDRLRSLGQAVDLVAGVS